MGGYLSRPIVFMMVLSFWHWCRIRKISFPTWGRLWLPLWWGSQGIKMGKIETFNYFRSITEKWRQKELKRLERRLKKKKKRNSKN
jgi:hypothetical protein